MRSRLDIKLEQLAKDYALRMPAHRANLIYQMLEILIIKHQKYDEQDVYEMKRMDKNFKVEITQPQQTYLPFVTTRRRRKTDG